MIYLQNGKIVSSGKIQNDMDIGVENGMIAGLFPHKKRENSIDLQNRYISFGWIDIHCHGGDGCEFVDATTESIQKAAAIHAKHGTRVIIPTVSSSDDATVMATLSAIDKAKDLCETDIPGVHLEGPYFNPLMCGGQPGDAIRKPKKEEYLPILQKYASIISRWSYAPETDENHEFLHALQEYGVIPAIGHSAALFSEVESAFQAGNRLVTHLYSCTSTVTRKGGFRSGGIIEAAFLLDDLYVETIADGCHLPKELLQLIVKIKTPQRVALITDAIRMGGKNIPGLTVTDCPVPFVVEDGVAKLLDRSAFAGSIATMDRLFVFARSCGFSIEDTVIMMTETPANIMRLERYGKIDKGYKALFTVFDEQGNIYPLYLPEND